MWTIHPRSKSEYGHFRPWICSLGDPLHFAPPHLEVEQAAAMASGGPEVLHQRPPVSPDVPTCPQLPRVAYQSIQEGLSVRRPPEAVCHKKSTTFISISDHHKKTNLYDSDNSDP